MAKLSFSFLSLAPQAISILLWGVSAPNCFSPKGYIQESMDVRLSECEAYSSKRGFSTLSTFTLTVLLLKDPLSVFNSL